MVLVIDVDLKISRNSHYAGIDIIDVGLSSIVAFFLIVNRPKLCKDMTISLKDGKKYAATFGGCYKVATIEMSLILSHHLIFQCQGTR